MNIPSQDIHALRDLMHLLVRMSENATRWGGNGITFPEEIVLLARVIGELESQP